MADTASQPLNAQQYLEQLRALREQQAAQGQAGTAPPLPQTSPQPQNQSQPAAQPQPGAPSAPPQRADAPPLYENQYNDQLVDERYYRPQPEEVMFEWKAESRPFKRRDRQYFMTIGIIVFLISLILFFAGQFLPIAVVVAIAFLAYVLSSVQPEVIVNKITTYGIHNDEAFYYWDELGRFWLDTKFGKELVHIETSRFPGRITLLVTSEDEKNQVTEILSELLLQEKPKDTAFDKAAKWLQDKIPLDTDR